MSLGVMHCRCFLRAVPKLIHHMFFDTDEMISSHPRRNYNYGAAAPSVRRPILTKPNLVALDPVLAFETSLWFWTTPSGTIPSIHNVITGEYVPTQADINAGRLPGFGLTIDIINGGLECGTATPQAANRVTYFKQFCSLLGVDPGPNLTCENMTPY